MLFTQLLQTHMLSGLDLKGILTQSLRNTQLDIVEAHSNCSAEEKICVCIDKQNTQWSNLTCSDLEEFQIVVIQTESVRIFQQCLKCFHSTQIMPSI